MKLEKLLESQGVPPGIELSNEDLVRLVRKYKGLLKERERDEAFWVATNENLKIAYERLDEREKELAAARAELEKRVEERTAELEKANERLRTEISDRKRAEEEATSQRGLLDSIIDLNPYSVQICDKEGHHVRGNRAFLELFKEAPPPEYSIFDDPNLKKAGVQELVRKAKGEGAVRIPEIWYNPHDIKPEYPDKLVCIRTAIFALSAPNGEIQNVVLMHDDITERKRAQEELQRNLREKEVLLREVHHRVKNNLQVINSMLRLQARWLDDERLTQALTDSQNRVNAMALLHQTLYGMADVARIDFAEYVRTLARELCRAHGVDTKRISIQVKAEDVTLGLEKASPCGQIVTELISNSLKHAFPEGRGGHGRIEICLRALDKGIIEVVVSDNGIGMPEDLDAASSRSLGLYLVTMLAEDQLDGAVEWRSENGARARITFPGG